MNSLPIIDKLKNGAFVLARARLPHVADSGQLPAEIVLCFMPGNAVTPFITWHRITDDSKENAGDLFWGHYFTIDAMGEAYDDFKKRAARHQAGE